MILLSSPCAVQVIVISIAYYPSRGCRPSPDDQKACDQKLKPIAYSVELFVQDSSSLSKTSACVLLKVLTASHVKSIRAQTAVIVAFDSVISASELNKLIICPVARKCCRGELLFNASSLYTHLPVGRLVVRC